MGLKDLHLRLMEKKYKLSSPVTNEELGKVIEDMKTIPPAKEGKKIKVGSKNKTNKKK